MNERAAQLALFTNLRGSCSLMIPNYTPFDWFECDLFMVTKAGFSREYEIKRTLADFQNDRKKATSTRYRYSANSATWERVPSRGKHELLSEGNPLGPNQFFYVVPRGLIKPDEIPTWAGLISARESPQNFHLHLEIEKVAPRLHKEKVREKVLQHARGVFFWRFWNLAETLFRNSRKKIPLEVKP